MTATLSLESALKDHWQSGVPMRRMLVFTPESFEIDVMPSLTIGAVIEAVKEYFSDFGCWKLGSEHNFQLVFTNETLIAVTITLSPQKLRIRTESD